MEEELLHDLKEMAAEAERLRKFCHPECPECGLSPNNEQGQAVLYCDECVCELQAEIERLRELKRTCECGEDEQCVFIRERDQAKTGIDNLLGALAFAGQTTGDLVDMVIQLKVDNDRLCELIRRWHAFADAGELDGVDLQLMSDTDEALGTEKGQGE